MTAYKRNIAVLSFGIFLFPIVFHSLHVVAHHLHDHDQNNHSLHPGEIEKPAHVHFAAAVIPHKPCAVCAYEFSINEEPFQVAFAASLPAMGTEIAGFVTQGSFHSIVSNQSPRAPPDWLF